MAADARPHKNHATKAMTRHTPLVDPLQQRSGLRAPTVGGEVVRNNPPAALTWYFMQPLSHRYFSGLFAAEELDRCLERQRKGQSGRVLHLVIF
jgi:hypothetical protein